MFKKNQLYESFIKSQLASIVASVVDFGTFIFLVQICHIWYVAATSIGAFFGAVTHFTFGRYWSFDDARDGHPGGQAFRYALVAAASLLLNTGAVYLFTEYGKMPSWVSKLVASFAIGVSFNFFLHRFFVFRKMDYD